MSHADPGIYVVKQHPGGLGFMANAHRKVGGGGGGGRAILAYSLWICKNLWR